MRRGERAFPSTRWVYVPEKIFSPPEAHTRTSAEGRPPRMQPRNIREPLTMTIKLRGGAEAWFEIQSRGRVWRVPGHPSILDVMLWVNSDGDLGPPH